MIMVISLNLGKMLFNSSLKQSIMITVRLILDTRMADLLLNCNVVSQDSGKPFDYFKSHQIDEI
jgi:hypothetical protein